MSIADTDSLSNLVLTTEIFPDWSAGVTLSISRNTPTFQARSAREQRVSHNEGGLGTMELVVDGRNADESANLIQRLSDRSVRPLLIPWFVDGLRISTDMGDADSMLLEVEPMPNWAKVGAEVLVGTERRTVEAIDGRDFDLETEGGTTAQSAGTWVFPMRRALLDRPNEAADFIRHDAARLRLRFTAMERLPTA